MKRGIRWCINGLFLLAGSVAVALLAFQMRRQAREAEPEPLAGFQVFCESEEISALFPAEDCLWVGGRDGVKRLDIRTGEVLGYVAEDLELIYAAEITRTADGAVWVGHNEGVTRFAPDGTREDFGAPELTGGRVNALLCAGECLWVGTMEGASLLEAKDGTWTVTKKYTKENGLLSNTVNVLAGQAGEIWFGSYLDNRPGGISILTAKGWQYLTLEDGLAHPYINAVLPLEDKILVASGQLTAGGLNRVERVEPEKQGEQGKQGEQEEQREQEERGEQGEQEEQREQEERGEQGEQEERREQEKQGKQSYQVTDTFGTEDGIPGEKVRWLYLDSSGYLWITTENDGLILTKGTDLTHPIEGVVLTWEQGLSDNEIKRIVEMGDYYFLAGRYGLTRIEKQAIAALMEGEKHGQSER